MTGHLERAQERVGDVGEGGKSLVQLQAERMAESRFIGLMAGAGVGYNQIAKEVLFFLPKDFLDLYEELWHEGVAGKDDGGSGARGQSQHDTGVLGKAATRNVPGGMQISSGGAKRKGYKKYWVIADEEALELKDRIDKRLRGIAREARGELDTIRRERAAAAGSRVRGEGQASAGGEDSGVEEQYRVVAGRSRVGASSRRSCSGCGRLVGVSWKFCAGCGHRCEG